MKKVLVINANPKSESLCQSLADKYTQIASSEHDVKQVNVSEMNFEMSLDQGYDTVATLEPDLVYFQQSITWAEHIVIIAPVWWGTVPAKFKGVIDRVFLPNFAFKYVTGNAFPKKLLSGRSSELIITMDTPPFYYKFFKGNAIYKQLKMSILDFSGIKNRSTTYFGPVIGSTDDKRKKWIDKVAKLARQIK